MEILGLDIGGSGIKGAIVDTTKGKLITDRYRIPTPKPATPEKVADTVKEICKHFSWKGKCGAGFPAVVQQGIVKTAANIDKSWIGTNAEKLFSKKTNCSFKIINDADAVGIAEYKYAYRVNKKGLCLIITIGTGLGSALINNGKLVPNTEFGHIEIEGKIAEHWASDAARKRDDLKWKEWAKRFNVYLNKIAALTWPNLIVLGGGASKKFDKYSKYIDCPVRIEPAQMLNEAGIIGAAYLANNE